MVQYIWHSYSAKFQCLVFSQMLFYGKVQISMRITPSVLFLQILFYLKLLWSKIHRSAFLVAEVTSAFSIFRSHQSNLSSNIYQSHLARFKWLFCFVFFHAGTAHYSPRVWIWRRVNYLYFFEYVYTSDTHNVVSFPIRFLEGSYKFFSSILLVALTVMISNKLFLTFWATACQSVQLEPPGGLSHARLLKTECVFVEVTMLKRNLLIKIRAFSFTGFQKLSIYIGLEISYVSWICYFCSKIEFALQFWEKNLVGKL